MQKRWWPFWVLIILWIGLLVWGGDLSLRLRGTLNPVDPIDIKTALPPLPSPEEGVAAHVYSRYPFNFKDELLISRGSDAGVQVGQPVVSNNFFVGQIVEVYEEAARARTIFDSRLQLPVRIGEAQVDAVLEGGPSPKLALIPDNISSGQEVYLAVASAPYGLFMGRTGEISTSQDKLFRNAVLQVAYNPGELRTVTVLKSPVAKNVRDSLLPHDE